MKREAYKSGLLLDLGFLLLLGVSMMGLGWIGYHGVDDLAYAIAAADWATEGPGLGANHWALRYPVVFPTSISFWVFGINELALVLPSILSFLGIIGLTYSFLRTHFDRISGLAAGVLVATTPQFSNYASWAGVELIEVLLVSSSLWLFATAPKQRPVKTLLLSGLVAGLAWSTRETAVSILVLYGVCFVLGYRYTRTQYLAWAAGFIGVIGLELLLLGLATGNPLYRWELDLAHVHCTPNDAAFLVRTAAWNWITAPLAVLAGDGAHGLLYLLAIISGGFLLFRNLPRAERQVVFLFIALALIHYVIVGHVAHLRMARYYAIITYVAVLVLGITFSYATRYERLRMAAYLVMVTLLASSLIVTGLRSGDRTFAARTVADFVMDERTQVYTDLRTRRMATFFFLDNRPLT
ncbi:MAG: glycosyltransferase family 39 protein, partial [Gammaproteobacteria bacterium]|nr:glycosyltransferase family 39 protein [Gammaproteobacteria bacterium]